MIKEIENTCFVEPMRSHDLSQSHVQRKTKRFDTIYFWIFFQKNFLDFYDNKYIDRIASDKLKIE